MSGLDSADSSLLPASTQLPEDDGEDVALLQRKPRGPPGRRPADAYDITRFMNATFEAVDEWGLGTAQWALELDFFVRELHSLSLAITAVGSIEIAISMPIVLLALGHDTVGEFLTFVLIAAAVLSQLAKRFLWRNRPHMDGRAVGLRTAQTSSFPSRAVLLYVVYAFTVAYCLDSSPGSTAWKHPPIWGVLVLVAVLVSSFGRMFLGEHYLSDCLLGAVAGLVCVVFGTLLEAWHTSVCGACAAGACYGGRHGMSEWPLITTPVTGSWILLLTSFVAFAILLIIMLVPPIRLWAKASHVLGLLLPCVSFCLGFLCPGSGPSKEPALPYPGPIGALSYSFQFFVVCAFVASLHVLGLVSAQPSRGMALRLGAFAALFVLVVGFLSLWRVYVR